MVQKYKKYPKNFFVSKKSCTFAPAFRRNRWQEVSRGLLCCAWNDNNNIINLK